MLCNVPSQGHPIPAKPEKSPAQASTHHQDQTVPSLVATFPTVPQIAFPNQHVKVRACQSDSTFLPTLGSAQRAVDYELSLWRQQPGPVQLYARSQTRRMFPRQGYALMGFENTCYEGRSR